MRTTIKHVAWLFMIVFCIALWVEVLTVGGFTDTYAMLLGLWLISAIITVGLELLE